MAITQATKKRKSDVSSRVSRLERRIGRITPDKQYVTISGATAATTAVGTHEYKVSMFPDRLLNQVNSDFIVEKVEYVVTSTGSNVGQMHTAILQPYSVMDAGQITSGTFDYINPKEYRVTSDRRWHQQDPAHKGVLQGAAKQGLVVRVKEDEMSNLSVEKNDTFLFIKYYQNSAASLEMHYHVLVTLREK